MLGGVVLQHQDDHLLRLSCCCSVVRSSADLDENARFDKNSPIQHSIRVLCDVRSPVLLCCPVEVMTLLDAI